MQSRRRPVVARAPINQKDFVESKDVPDMVSSAHIVEELCADVQQVATAKSQQDNTAEGPVAEAASKPDATDEEERALLHVEPENSESPGINLPTDSPTQSSDAKQEETSSCQGGNQPEDSAESKNAVSSTHIAEELCADVQQVATAKSQQGNDAAEGQVAEADTACKPDAADQEERAPVHVEPGNSESPGINLPTDSTTQSSDAKQEETSSCQGANQPEDFAESKDVPDTVSSSHIVEELCADVQQVAAAKSQQDNTAEGQVAEAACKPDAADQEERAPVHVEPGNCESPGINLPTDSPTQSSDAKQEETSSCQGANQPEDFAESKDVPDTVSSSHIVEELCADVQQVAAAKFQQDNTAEGQVAEADTACKPDATDQEERAPVHVEPGNCESPGINLPTDSPTQSSDAKQEETSSCQGANQPEDFAESKDVPDTVSSSHIVEELCADVQQVAAAKSQQDNTAEGQVAEADTACKPDAAAAAFHVQPGNCESAGINLAREFPTESSADEPRAKTVDVLVDPPQKPELEHEPHDSVDRLSNGTRDTTASEAEDMLNPRCDAWRCPTCGLLNEVCPEMCVLCEGPRPSGAPAVPPPVRPMWPMRGRKQRGRP